MNPALKFKGYSVISQNGMTKMWDFFFHADHDEKMQKTVQLDGKNPAAALAKLDGFKLTIDTWIADPANWLTKAAECFSEMPESTSRHIRTRQQQANKLSIAENNLKYKQHNTNVLTNTYSNSQTDDYDDDEFDIHSTDSQSSQPFISDRILNSSIFSPLPKQSNENSHATPIPKPAIENTINSQFIIPQFTPSQFTPSTKCSSSSGTNQLSTPQTPSFNSMTQLPNFDVPITENHLQTLLVHVGFLATSQEKPEYLRELLSYWNERLFRITKEQAILENMKSRLTKFFNVMDSFDDEYELEEDRVIETVVPPKKRKINTETPIVNNTKPPYQNKPITNTQISEDEFNYDSL